MKTILVTHAVKINEEKKVIQCPDAVAALWVVQRALGGLDKVEVVWQQYLAAKEYQNFDIPFEFDGRDVVFVDFCYPQHVMSKIASQVKSLTVLDHHETRANVVQDINNFSDIVLGKYSPKEIDCGATLAWKHYFPEQPLPWFLKRVWERDCGVNGYYQGKIVESEAFNNWLANTRYKAGTDQARIEIFDQLLELSEPMEKMIDLSVLEERNKLCVAEVKAWLQAKEFIELSGYNVPIIKISNPKCDRFYSFIAVAFLQNAEEKYQFVCIKTSNEPKTFHLRGFEHSEVKVNTVAEKYGGGGHDSAAGFTIAD